MFEILSNSIDEEREGHGDIITLTRYEDKSIEVEDFGRGCPVDWNPVEKRFNLELVFCELYAGGKYKNAEGENYEFSLGLNGLGSCARSIRRNTWTLRLGATVKSTACAWKSENVGAEVRADGQEEDRLTHTLEADLIFTDIDSRGVLPDV